MSQPRFISPLASISFNTRSATLNASNPAGMPQYALYHKLAYPSLPRNSTNPLVPPIANPPPFHLLPHPQTTPSNKHPKKTRRRIRRSTNLACKSASLISNSLAPFLTAPLTCVPNSTHLPSAVNMTRFSRLRVLSSRPGLVQMVPHADSCLRC